MQIKYEEIYALLNKIKADLVPKNGAECPICGGYSHQGWCWYPKLLEAFNYPLDKFDRDHLGHPDFGDYSPKIVWHCKNEK